MKIEGLCHVCFVVEPVEFRWVGFLFTVMRTAVNFRLVGLLSICICLMFTDTPAAAATTSLRSDGVLLVDGQPFYPYGYFYGIQ